MRYPHKNIDKKWQAAWRESGVYRTSEDPDKPKTFVLDMFPYPSGEGLHVGHPKGYIATDIYSRAKRMQGHSVLHPMGWDAFGLPAENYALKTKTHPRVAVEKNIARFKEQLSIMGFDYDWSREINTTDPAYYKWTQWIFLKLFENGLAFQSHEPINWCPSCMTGLANEDLDGDECERCGTKVEKKSLPQWVLKITDYADRMLADLDSLDWPEHIKESQRNWIGRSEGAEIDFPITTKTELTSGDGEKSAYITVFTTRADTLYGATYLVLAPEHPWLMGALKQHKTPFENKADILAYVASASAKNEIERSAEGREKTGVELKGVAAVNPATGGEIPVFVADYVLGSYGTGAVMGVPAHDERDLAFARNMGARIVRVIDPITGESQTDPVEKEKIVALVEHDGKILTIHWPDELGGRLLIGGTVEPGENPKETATREIREETGYTDLTLVEQAEERVHHSYFAFSKNRATLAHTTNFHFKLASEAKSTQALEQDEAEKFTVEWVTLDVALAEIHDEQHQYALARFLTHKPYTGHGYLRESGSFSGRLSSEAASDMVASVGGRMVTRYKLRDWIFSRQRYWGEPIPIIHCEKDGAVGVPYEDLPVLLPEVESYEPTGTGESPLAAISHWVNTTCPKCGGPGKRETNTMPQWAGSSWYYLRFMDPHDDTQLVSVEKEKYWAPVDVYVGGDHAVRHLIYARFWHKFLYDIGIVHTKESFARLEFLGFILAEDGRKMSKRLGNVISPEDVVTEYGADAFRLYEMFMGPFENTIAWSTAAIAGTARFVDRVWSLEQKVVDEDVESLTRLLHVSVQKVTNDIEQFKFNTAVSQMMIFQNAVEKAGKIGRAQWKIYLRLLAPFAPHLTEELWSKLGGSGSVHTAEWPVADPSLLMEDTSELVVQVAGKRRGSLMVRTDTPEEEAVTLSLAIPAVSVALGGIKPSRVVYVPGKILNLVP